MPAEIYVELDDGSEHPVENRTGLEDTTWARKRLEEGVVVEREDGAVEVYPPGRIRKFVIRGP